MSKKINPSWDRDGRSPIHSAEGVKELKATLKDGLKRFYIGIAESMFSYDMDDEKCQDMKLMSQDTMPEQWLMANGKATFFELAGQLQCLPIVYASQGINIYGKISEWSPMPAGYDTMNKAKNPALWNEIAAMKLNPYNAVIIKNDLMGRPDLDMIDKMVNALVDNLLTLNQIQLLASQPYIFNVTQDNVMTAKNFFLALGEHAPAVFVNAMGDKTIPQTEMINVKVDPGLFDLFDRFECTLLTYLGFPCVPISKRAQQSVSEVESNDAKLYARRMEKFNQRRQAIDRVNAMFGTNIVVHSVIDDLIAEQAVAANGSIDDDTNPEDDNDDKNR